MAQPTQARVAVLAASGALVSSLPVPIVPRRLLRVLRGALAHDVCARQGLSLSVEARQILADPAGTYEPSSLAQDALSFATKLALRRLSPLGVLVAPARTYFDTIVFGRLLARWLERHRASSPFGSSLRIEAEEARKIRMLLERASIGILSPSLGTQNPLQLQSPEDHRGSLQRATDRAVMFVATLPEAVERRLDAALDAALNSARNSANAGTVGT